MHSIKYFTICSAHRTAQTHMTHRDMTHKNFFQYTLHGHQASAIHSHTRHNAHTLHTVFEVRTKHICGEHTRAHMHKLSYLFRLRASPLSDIHQPSQHIPHTQTHKHTHGHASHPPLIIFYYCRFAVGVVYNSASRHRLRAHTLLRPQKSLCFLQTVYCVSWRRARPRAKHQTKAYFFAVRGDTFARGLVKYVRILKIR